MESVKRISIAFLVVGIFFLLIGYTYSNYGKGVALLVNMLCLGTVTAYLAHGKNRSKFGWFLIGSFTGIVGLAVVMGIKPNENPSE